MDWYYVSVINDQTVRRRNRKLENIGNLPQFFRPSLGNLHQITKTLPCDHFFGQKFVKVTGQARCKENQTSPNPPAETGARQMTEEKTDRAIEFCPKDGMSEAGNI